MLVVLAGLFVSLLTLATPTPAPGDGLGLAPGAPAPLPASRSHGGVPRLPLGWPGAGLGGTAAAAAALDARRRSRDRRHGAMDDTLFVFVPGHGGSPQDFDDLARRMGIPPDQVRVFDYRWVLPDLDRVTASRWATADEAADALGAYVAAEAEEHRRIYLIGHSKGGAIVADLVGRWDRRPELTPDGVVGAALLDPAIASGPLGWLQRVGFAVGPLADNGLFDPVRCGADGCHDLRRDLGRRAGVEVVVVRNPDALVTNFHDRPDGLRVYDLVEDGGRSAWYALPDVGAFARRVAEAHASVLHDDRVAGCLAAEATLPGSCHWPGGRQRASIRRPRGRRGGGALIE